MILIIVFCWLLLGFILGMPIYLTCRYVTSNPTDNEEERWGRNRRLSQGFWLMWGALWVGGSALFLPALGRAHEPPRRAACLSNLKQIGLAIAMYSDADRYHRCPMDGNPPTLVGSLRLLSNEVSSAKILCCPSDRGRHPETDFSELTTSNTSYSYVPNLIWNPDHADSIVALDRINETTAGSWWPQTGNHNDAGGNVLFSDGTVRFMKTLPSALKDKDGKQVVLSP